MAAEKFLTSMAAGFVFGRLSRRKQAKLSFLRMESFNCGTQILL
jgi:hypothetical protein